MSDHNPDHDSVVLKLNQLAYLLNIIDDALVEAKTTGPCVAQLLIGDAKRVLGELRKQVLK